MRLINDFMKPMVLLEKTRIPDGEGGWETTWAEGAEFEAALTLNNSIQAKTAEMAGVTSLYTVTMAKATPLEYHDVFKRLEDGKIFRVTSDPKEIETPERAGFSFKQCSAESWRLT